MFDRDFLLSDRLIKKRALLQAQREALSAIESAAHDGNITAAEAQILKRQVAITHIAGNLLASLEHPIWKVSRKTERLTQEISQTLHQARERANE
jgi:hypothetical protein